LSGGVVQLDKMTAQVRPRPAWEAVDLGFMMLQRWYRPVISSWVLFTLPIFILINILLYDHPFLAAMAFWWLLPIFDRIPLHIISRALFAEPVTARDILREWRGILLPHLIKMLTVHRFDTTRSYNLPIWQLEKLRGQARAQRSRVLRKIQSSNAVGLGFMCISIELVLYMSLYGLVMLFMPDSYDQHMTTALFEQGKVWWVGPLANSFLYITFMIVEPFYVAGGFSLYINRRTELEGWDIEVAFRQLAQRISPQTMQVIIVLAFTLMLPVGLMHSSPARAADNPDQTTVSESAAKDSGDKTTAAAVSGSPTNNAVAKKAITSILDDKVFHQKQKVSGWRLKHPVEANSNQNLPSTSWLGLLGNSIASFGQLLLWIVVTALIIGAIYLLVKWVPTGDGGGGKQKKQPPAPKSLFGLDITPESLPEDIGATALNLWRAGKLTEALSLLYRGALTTLVHRDGINLRGSSTEGDCLRIVARHTDKVSATTREFFQQLTLQWQIVAYAHRRPDDTLVSELCRGWSSHFGEAA